jgi:DNA-binding Lrp family transcriptional regulator
MKGFYIEITNNLLEPKHRKQMGTAVWEFMWCLDKITKIDDDQIGWVLGGKPIQLREIKNNIGITEPKISQNLNKLQAAGYLNIQRTQYGVVISINRAKKRFAQKVKSENLDLPIKAKPSNLKGKAKVCPKGQNPIYDDKTVVIDKTVKTIAPASGAVGEIIPDLLKDKQKHVQIIGIFALAKHVNFESVKHQRTFIHRHTKAAAEISCYDLEKIKKVMRWLYVNATDIKWTIETVGKYIDEDLNKLRANRHKIIICQ